MGVVILLWALTALGVVVGRARRASWKTVRRYEAGQRALARLGPEQLAPSLDDDGDAPVGDDPCSHVRLLEGDHLPPPRPAFGGQPAPRARRRGWALAGGETDARPSVSIDTRSWSAPVDTAAEGPAPRRKAAAPADTAPVTLASLIRVARPSPARPGWTSRAPVAPRPARVLVGAAAAVLTLLATGVAATMHTGPSEASVSARRAATTRPATSRSQATRPHAGPHAGPAAPPSSAAPPAPIQISGDAQQAIVTSASGTAVQVAARAPCWIQVRAGSTGAVLAQSTLGAGQTAAFPWQDGLWMRLGDPSAVSVSVDGRVLALPAQAGQPIDLSFARA